MRWQLLARSTLEGKIGMLNPVLRTICTLILLLTMAATCLAADWPTWRYDEQRRGTSPEALPEQLSLQWVREFPTPMRAWPYQWDDAGKLCFDVSYEPVVMGTTLVVGSMVSDSITAYDTRTGEELWRYYVNGPVRFAPALWEGRVYAGSDDGYLYCLDLDSGELVWRFHAAPRDRYLLGNERMINMWAVRGAPVIRDGTLYCAAGVFPGMGTFFYSLDAATGEVNWCNSGTGSIYNLHQHGGAHSFGGAAPQGYVAVTEDRVIFPGGRTPPAVHDRETGEFIYWRHASHQIGKGSGGFGVWVQSGFFHNPNRLAGDQMYALCDGAQHSAVPSDVVSDDYRIGLSGGNLVGHAAELNVTEVEVTDRLARRAIRERYELVREFSSEMDVEATQLHIRAGDRVYVSNPDGLIAAIDLPGEDGEARVSWQGQIDGTPWRMIAADERLFVVSEEGALFCFGAEETEVVRHTGNGVIDRPQDAWAGQAAAMLDAAGREGFTLVLGAGSGRLVHELVGQSEMHVIVVEPDAATVEQMRRLYDDAGYYGRRVAVLQADPATIDLSPYFATLITAESLEALSMADPAAAGRLFEVLRPYGGMALLPLSDAEHAAVGAWAQASGAHGAQVSREGAYTAITREGALPGAGQWTHQYADPANSGVSWDDARAPLGVLWYGGGYNNHDVLPRHMSGPVPQVVGGRLFIMGPDTMTARDVFTGRELWVREMPDVGIAFTCREEEAKQARGEYAAFPGRPGANFVGSPYVSLDDGIYIVHEGRCLRLDPATGELMSEFTVSAPDGEEAEMGWGFVVYDDLIVTGVSPQWFDDAPVGHAESWNATSSDHLAVLNRHTGEQLWHASAEIGFRHNSIIAGGGKVFVLDNLSPTQLELLERRGDEPEAQPGVGAFDARTGELLWAYQGDIFGTWLSYSEEHDVLVQAGRPGGRARLADEPRHRMAAFNGSSGELLWDREARQAGPIALHGERIIPGQRIAGVHLLTGENYTREHPITGAEVPWSFRRMYGCGEQTVSRNLITFRSGAAGFYDLARDGGTGNMSGFRSGARTT